MKKDADYNIDQEKVPGSPYWMAPEIVQLNPADFASDIWSIGATIIELLTTKPPFFELSPAQAMFKIIEVEKVPIPKNISTELKLFLNDCFHKQQFLRPKAIQLLRYKWITDVESMSENSKSSGVVPHPSRPINSENTTKSHKGEGRKVHTAYRPDPSTNPQPISPIPSERYVEDDIGPIKAKGKNGTFNTDDVVKLKGQFKDLYVSNGLNKVFHSDSSTTSGDSSSSLSSSSLSTSIDQSSDDVIPDTKKDITKKELIQNDSDNNTNEEDALNSDHNDLDDFFSSSDNDNAAKSKKTSFETKSSERENQAKWMNETKADNLSTPVKSNRDNEQGNGEKLGEHNMMEGSLDDFFISGDESDDNGDDDNKPRHDTKITNSRNADHKAVSKTISRVKEEIESMDDLTEDFTDISPSEAQAQQSEDDDIFKDLDLIDKDDDVEVSLDTVLNDLKVVVDSKHKEKERIDASVKTMETFQDTPILRSALLNTHGAVLILDILSCKMNSELLLKNVQLINSIVCDSRRMQEALCMTGAITSIMKYSSSCYNDKIRLAVTKLVHQIVHGSDISVKMFISANGLLTLVSLLKDNNKKITENAIERYSLVIECILSVLELDSCIPMFHNNMCRLFSKLDLLKSFTSVFSKNFKKLSQEILHKICSTLVIFSRGDTEVKKQLCQHNTLVNILNVFEQSRGETFSLLLNSIFNVSMIQKSSYVQAEALYKAGIVKILVKRLDLLDKDTSLSKEAIAKSRNQILNSLYSICTLHIERFEDAMRYGIVYHLERIIKENGPLKVFAMPMILQAHQSTKCVIDLWKRTGIDLFLNILQQRFPWNCRSMDIIEQLLTVLPLKERKKAEQCLITENNMKRFITGIMSAKNPLIFSTLPVMIQTSKLLRNALWKQRNFIKHILVSIRMDKEPQTLRYLAMCLKELLHKGGECQRYFTKRYGLHRFLITMKIKYKSNRPLYTLLSEMLKLATKMISPKHKFNYRAKHKSKRSKSSFARKNRHKVLLKSNNQLKPDTKLNALSTNGPTPENGHQNNDNNHRSRDNEPIPKDLASSTHKET